MKSDIIIQLHKNFEDYAHQIDGEEYWFARDLQGLLGYSKWENFAKVIDKAKIACQTAGENRDTSLFYVISREKALQQLFSL